jgi:hypothetical protein
MKLLLTILFTTSVGFAEIDLTPHPSVRELEGCKFPEIKFHGRDGEITYEPPSGWTTSPRGKNQLFFYIADKAQAYAKIEETSDYPQGEFDEAVVQQLKEELLSALPADSESIAIVGQTALPLMINRRKTYELAVNFALHGQRFTSSVIFLNLASTQLRFTVSSPVSDYKELHDRFVESLYTWQWLDAPSPRALFRRRALSLR